MQTVQTVQTNMTKHQTCKHYQINKQTAQTKQTEQTHQTEQTNNLNFHLFSFLRLASTRITKEQRITNTREGPKMLPSSPGNDAGGAWMTETPRVQPLILTGQREPVR